MKQESVDEIKGGKYRDGIFSFYFKNSQISFGLREANERYGYRHHLDMNDIELLNSKFPRYIPLYDEKEYSTLTEWGYEVEAGLRELMIANKFFCNVDGEQRQFVWVGQK